MTQLDMLESLRPPCGECRHLGAAIDSGIRHCGALFVWRWATDRPECQDHLADVGGAPSGQPLGGDDQLRVPPGVPIL
jgi:hypothetical protein